MRKMNIFYKSITSIFGMFMKMEKKNMYNNIFVWSFGRLNLKWFGYGALVSCIVLTWFVCGIFKPYNLGPLPIFDETRISCNMLNKSADTCIIKGDIRIQGNISTIFVYTPYIGDSSWTIKPYARKEDQKAMQYITNFTIKSVRKQAKTKLECTQTHNVPAILFSVGGYAGNHFHAFSDVVMPLYETSRVFKRQVQFLIANKNSRWTTKFHELLDNLSKYEIIDVDHENEVHCFSSMIVGLKKQDQKELHLDSMHSFKEFLRTIYSLARPTAIKIPNGSTKPRLLLLSRQKTRAFTNVKDIVRAASDMGYEVIVSEMGENLTHVSRLVNSCDVMMGVHGAGLTNMVFQPENSVLIQVVPWGKMEGIARCYGDPSKAMGLKYLEYKISEQESSLSEKYPLNHQVFVDPYSIQSKGWNYFKRMYMDNQNVNLDVVRFKEVLEKALELLH